VEYDASRRAKAQLMRLGLVTNRELGDVDKVLGAAALTYVAALVNALLQLLKLVMLARSRDDR
jgi:Zn-dependent membrane protease YugP